MFHSYMQSIKSLSAISYKSNIRNADELQFISQMSAIDVYDYVKHFTANKFIDTIVKYIFSFVFCVLLFLILCGNGDYRPFTENGPQKT